MLVQRHVAGKAEVGIHRHRAADHHRTGRGLLFDATQARDPGLAERIGVYAVQTAMTVSPAEA